MINEAAIKGIRDKYVELLDDLDERGRRRWAAVEARALGWGGITAVARATGMSCTTIGAGLRELEDAGALAAERQRRPGGGTQEAHGNTTWAGGSIGSIG